MKRTDSAIRSRTSRKRARINGRTQRDRELLENLRRKQAELKTAMSAATETMGALCPHCHQQLLKGEKAGVAMLACPSDEGAWVDQAELNKLLQRLK